ncbi:unnamed protein product [Ectocarpus fasciculatus]
MAGGADLIALSDLLQGAGQEDQDERAQADQAQGKIFTPGDFGPPRIAEKPTQASNSSDPQAIWSEEEAQEEDDAFFDPDDKRPQPEYDFVYKQSVMTEDTFLGMAGKTPGSQDCTHIVVKVVFPGCRMRDLELDVTRRAFLAASPKLRLATYLPFSVDETKGVAKWDAGNETLSVTLPIVEAEW